MKKIKVKSLGVSVGVHDILKCESMKWDPLCVSVSGRICPKLLIVILSLNKSMELKCEDRFLHLLSKVTIYYFYDLKN